MTNLKSRPLPDGRMRVIWLLNEKQKEALRTLRPDGLLVLNFYETEMKRTETWIEYWIDRNTLNEDALRSLINKIISDIR
jgi:hypothetical protein